MQYLVRLVTPPNGIVLDPFMGSGSTGKACMLEGFRFIGVDMELEYCEIAKARILHVCKFSAVAVGSAKVTPNDLPLFAFSDLQVDNKGVE
jgi:site-specific DNA-methyltransferase (adenine-specific)